MDKDLVQATQELFEALTVLKQSYDNNDMDATIDALRRVDNANMNILEGWAILARTGSSQETRAFARLAFTGLLHDYEPVIEHLPEEEKLARKLWLANIAQDNGIGEMAQA